MAPSSQPADISSSLSKLSLDSRQKSAGEVEGKTKKNNKQPVADSWEDEEDSSSSSEEEAQASAQSGAGVTPPTASTPLSPNSEGSGFRAPPPTPNSPTNHYPGRPWDVEPSPRASPRTPMSPESPASPDRRRPEKTDAVARRMIASALGVRAPRATEEQRAYDRSVREQERKRREQEKAAEAKRKEEADKAKAAMWDD